MPMKPWVRIACLVLCLAMLPVFALGEGMTAYESHGLTYYVWDDWVPGDRSGEIYTYYYKNPENPLDGMLMIMALQNAAYGSMTDALKRQTLSSAMASVGSSLGSEVTSEPMTFGETDGLRFSGRMSGTADLVGFIAIPSDAVVAVVLTDLGSGTDTLRAMLAEVMTGGEPDRTEEAPAEEPAAEPAEEPAEEPAGAVPDLESLSTEELMALRGRIDEILAARAAEQYTELRRGDRGDAVSALQARLKALGFFTGRVSGKFDNLTEKAVTAFQSRYGLSGSGVATVETQTLLFSAGLDPDETAAPARATPVPTATPDPRYADYVPIDYRDCARNPENHIGEQVVMKGKVVQVIGSKQTGFMIRLELTGGDVIYLNVPANTVDVNILENDRLTVYARMQDLKTYESIFGQSITIPQATVVDLILN